MSPKLSNENVPLSVLKGYRHLALTTLTKTVLSSQNALCTAARGDPAAECKVDGLWVLRQGAGQQPLWKQQAGLVEKQA